MHDGHARRKSSLATKGRRVKQIVPELLAATLLQDELTIKAAISALESHLVDPATPVQEVINELLSVVHCLEYVLSAVNDDVFDLLRQTILQRWPRNAEEFLESSLASRLLSRFSLFLFFLPYPDSSTAPPSLLPYRQRTESALPVLQALAKFRFDHTTPVMDEGADDMSEFSESLFLVKKKTQHKRKQSKRVNRAPVVDTKAFAHYGADVPTTREEALELAGNEYLEMFRLPQLAPLIKSMYIPKHMVVAEPLELTETPADLSVSTAAESEIPAAYPLVQPMRAALYFDSADGFGEWRVLISARADRDLRQARNKSPKLFKIIVKKIKELSCGHFSDDNQKRLTGLNVEIPIYEAKMTGDTRLVYQVDCIPEFESDVERQVLRIFGIYSHAQLDRRFWDCMSRHLERKGAEYKKRCTFRNPPLVHGDNVVLPASWPPSAESGALQPALTFSDLRKEDLEELHSLLVLEKFVTFSQALLNSILADQDVAHVFDVSPHEKKIIEHPSSCYVLGESPSFTKTTTMLFKMLGIERSWESCRDTMPKPRQLFVTQSRVLAEKVEEYFAKLLESLATANQSPTELAALAARKKNQQQQGLVDRDEEIYWRGDLPKRYGALKEEHFPMFLTYDHICRLLEAEFHFCDYEKRKQAAVAQAIQDVLELRDPDVADGALSNDYMQQRRASFVSYGTFLEEYWSHFPQTLTKGLDPTLVFGEFMGVIKGSEQSLSHPEGYLDRDAYYKLSHRTQATFASQRENIYRLFQAYLKRKKERGDYDAADRTHALIDCLRTMGVPGQEVDFIYVDEAQDNLLIDAVVLRTLCRNPHGMFWAGDTAQTISVGSAFRFDDLKAFLYRYEEATANGKADKRTQPESFHLAVNYRSHAGIVDCAYSVIELITEFWPHAIDFLGRETGMVEGMKPVFFSGWDQNTVRYEQFLFGESGSHIEFGAQQCILVRDEAARERLRAQVGDIGLILTLYESKGLEFNDVLLFNFFEDSTVDLSQWRVVLNALPAEQRANHPAPRFDDARHSGVCRELKFLYVAITRARKNLWIADCSEKGEPMRILWTQKGLVQNCDPGTDVPQLAMSSTAEDWAKMALELFNNRRYMQAMHCYERAGLAREKAVAHAYHLREVARSTLVHKGDTTARAIAYISAAEAFVSSAHDAITEKRAYYRIAAECYVHGGDDQKAAQAYLNAGEYTLAAQHFRKAGRFEEAVAVVKSHRERMAASVAESIVEVSRLYYLRENNIKKATELFHSPEEALEYMDDYGLDVARASLLEQLGRYADAAELHLCEGNTLEAIRLLTLDRGNSQSIKRAMQCLLDGLWRHLPCGTVVTETLFESDATLVKLLQHAETIGDLDADSDLRDEVTMFRAIARRDMDKLRTLRNRFSARGNLAAAFLCLDHVFSTPLKLQTAPLAEVVETLQTFAEYVHMLHSWSVDREASENKAIRKLFAIQTSSEDLFFLPRESFLSTQTNSRITPSVRATDLGISLPRWELEQLLKSVLNGLLLRRVKEENHVLRALRVLQPCLTYVVYQQCNRVECPRHHGDFQHYDAIAYNTRVRIILQQILIYHSLHAIEHPRERAHQRNFWLEQLHAALFPQYYKLGSFCVLDATLLPELQQGLQVVQVWVRDLLYDLKPFGGPKGALMFLTTLIRATRICLVAPSKNPDYLQRIPSVAVYRPENLLRNPEKAYVVHDLLSFMQNGEEKSLTRGILFMNHVLENQVAIDIAILCDVMQNLCGNMLVTRRLKKNEGGLHNLTLPKSWLMRIIPGLESLRSRDTQLSFLFKKHLGGLLEQIYDGTPWLLYDGRELSTLGFPVRNVFFARVCMIFCLWGYNISSWELRNDIVRALASVRKPGRTFHPLIDKYVNARSWEHLARAIRSAVSGAELDEMIQLHHGSHPLPRTSLPNVRRVVYHREQDIPWLLKTGGTSIPAPTGLRVEAAPFVPSRMSSEPVQDVADDGEDTPEDDTEEANEDVMEQAVDMENIAQAIDAEQANVAPAAPTQEELAAAKAIAEAYQRYAARTRLRKVKPKEEKRRRVFGTFQAEAQKMNWPHTYYRLLYQGPIPHLFIVTEGMKSHLYDAKNNAKKRLNFVKHLELENVQSTLTQTIRLFKEAEKLHKSLGPAADVHKARDLEALKGYALQAEELMRTLPPAVSEEWRDDMKIALKGIVETKKPPKREPKPELQVEDDLVDIEDFHAEEPMDIGSD
ncbi:hypothetical protein BV20DRAFT_945276 [Pilatotrama ljubarskyi]|nr:hypothetical protein BV20DRAFT_945276 [Pilatotrama ljubarskyi]